MIEQHRKLEGEEAPDPILTSAEARVVINGAVHNLQVNQNSLGVQITGDQLQQINEAVDEASPSTLSEIVKTSASMAVNCGASRLCLA